MENNFVEHVSWNIDFRISYQASWRIVSCPQELLFQPTDGSSDAIFRITIHQNFENLNLKDQVDSWEKVMLQSYTTFKTLESSPLSLGEAEAYRLVCNLGGIRKSLTIITIKNGKTYYLLYVALEENYTKYLSVVEQMISSFKFIDLESATGQIPRLSLLTRPMIDANRLPTAGYDVEYVEVIEEATGKVDTAYNHVRYFEFQPIETTYSLIFGSKGKKEVIEIFDLKQVKGVKMSSVTKGRFTKKEDLIVEVKLIKDDGKCYFTRINVDDNYAHEIVNAILSSKRAELDKTYWTHRSLTQDGQKNTIDIYPLTPFLATGEEIVWQSLKAHTNDKNGKVIWIDALTNYRVFQYSYEEHKGTVILFPSAEDVRIINEARGPGLGQYSTSSPYLTGIQSSGVTGIVGDVVFYSQASPWITFTQVADPETLSTVVRTLNQQQANTHIGDGETELTVLDEPKNDAAVINNTNQWTNPVCTKCDYKDNPVGSKFCNQCGSPLSFVCAKCGSSNPTEAIFCGQCGSKLGE